jgi:hypothetical protein
VERRSSFEFQRLGQKLPDDIREILVLDDNPGVRQAYTYPIEDAGRIPMPIDGQLGTLDQFLSRDITAQAAISDYQLSSGNYAAFDGANLVARWYQARFPAVLCTTFDKSNVAQFRALRRWIPIILPPQELDPDTLMGGLELVQREIDDDFTPARRPWRALVTFVEFDRETNTANARVAGWGDEVVALRATDLDPALLAALEVAGSAEYRCYAWANLGSESNDELYLADWEPR